MKRFLFVILLTIFSIGVFNNVYAQANTSTDLPKATGVENSNFAPGAYELISPIGNMTKVDDQSPNGFSDFVNLIIRIAIALAGAFAVLTIIFSGVQYMGSDSVWEKGESKGRMTAAIGGLILLFCSYLILYTINPDLVNIKIGGARLNEGEWDEIETVDYDSTPTSSSAECTGGLVKIPSNIAKTSKVTDSICKDLATKLTALKSKSSVDWIITATTNGTHASKCHKTGTKKTGACVDIALRDSKGNPVPASSESWGTLCEAVKSIPGIDFLNEASKTPKCEAIHKNVQTTYGKGSHLHIIYTGK